MNIYEKVTKKILFYLDKMEKDKDFKKNNPNITSKEYLYNKVIPNITSRRLTNILNGKAKIITLAELVYIAQALNIEVYDLFKY